jgi:Tfp pilus assembly protein PilF
VLPPIRSHKRQAAEYLKENRPDLAATEFKAIVALDPGNIDALGNLGVLLFFQGA